VLTGAPGWRRVRARAGAAAPTRTIACAVGLAAGLVALAGCGGEEAGTAELRFWAMGREGEVVAELVSEFEAENPDIRVRVQQIPWTAAHEKLLTAFVGEATPDVSQLGNTWVPEFEALGALAPLDAWLDRPGSPAAEDFFPGILATNELDGRVYGVPWYVDTRVLFYRTDLLAEAGYDAVPDTWEGLREAMLRMKADMEPGQHPLFMPTNEWPPPVILGVQAGSSLLDEAGRRGMFAEDAFRRGFDFYVSLYRDSLAAVVSSTEVSNLFQEFARGNIALYITGPWNIGEFSRRLPEDVQDDWGTAPLPGFGGPGASIAGGSSLVMFRGTEHPEAAWRLMAFLSRPEQQVRFYELTGDLPSNRSAWDAPALADNPYTDAFRTQLERVVPMPKVPEWENIATRVFEYGDQVVRGRTGAGEGLEALDRDVDRLLEKRRWMLDRASAGDPDPAEGGRQP
jgi:multiple sugar transport system substrate-binding protein